VAAIISKKMASRLKEQAKVFLNAYFEKNFKNRSNHQKKCMEAIKVSK